MQKQIYSVHYGTKKRNVQLKLDEYFAEKIIPADDSVRLFDERIENSKEVKVEIGFSTGRRDF
ncbi:MAG TPA: hypothetical protein VFF80_03105 [Bacillota bacterium]|nr:hypothetical protein [Bacillota bacterium]